MESMLEQAKRMRVVMEKLSITASDEVLLEAPEIAPFWKIGENVQVDERRYYQPTKLLYKARIAHMTQEDWTPDLTPNLWAIVTLDEQQGTLNNPIIAVRGMEYEYGLYYKDPETDNIYLCSRTGENIGNKVVLQYLPHELEGLYFKANN
jgi:hypothetical protein